MAMQSEIQGLSAFYSFLQDHKGRARYFRTNLAPAVVLGIVWLDSLGNECACHQFMLATDLPPGLSYALPPTFRGYGMTETRANMALGMITGALTKNGFGHLVNREGRNLDQNYVEEISFDQAQTLYSWFSEESSDFVVERLLSTDDLRHRRVPIPLTASELWGTF